MKEIIAKIFGSLDTKAGSGFSGRKLTAVAIILCDVAAHIKWMALGDFEQLEMILTIDYAFVAALFGLTTYQSMKTPSVNEEALQK